MVKLCKERLGWKSTTTYTVIKRLSERGVIKNENTIVSSIVSKEQIQEAEIVNMVEKTFEGSLPAFISAFGRHEKLSEKEIEDIRRMIEKDWLKDRINLPVLRLFNTGGRYAECFFKNFINWHECQLDDIGYLVLAYSVLEVSKMDCMLYVVFGRNKALMPL